MHNHNFAANIINVIYICKVVIFKFYILGVLIVEHAAKRAYRTLQNAAFDFVFGSIVSYRKRTKTKSPEHNVF